MIMYIFISCIYQYIIKPLLTVILPRPSEKVNKDRQNKIREYNLFIEKGN